MQRATLKDVAEQAGVHVATASRALNEASRHMVRADTLERVWRSASPVGPVVITSSRAAGSHGVSPSEHRRTVTAPERPSAVAPSRARGR